MEDGWLWDWTPDFANKAFVEETRTLLDHQRPGDRNGESSPPLPRQLCFSGPSEKHADVPAGSPVSGDPRPCTGDIQQAPSNPWRNGRPLGISNSGSAAGDVRGGGWMTVMPLPDVSACGAVGVVNSDCRRRGVALPVGNTGGGGGAGGREYWRRVLWNSRASSKIFESCSNKLQFKGGKRKQP